MVPLALLGNPPLPIIGVAYGLAHTDLDQGGIRDAVLAALKTYVRKS